MLRAYQQKAIDDLYAWFNAGNAGNPCLVLPTGSGKSHIIAAFCKDALQTYPETRILMLTHVKELIEQNAEKMLQHWPEAPLGIYSAGIGRRDLEEPITFAGIQSVRRKAEQIGHVELIIVDEAHLISHKDEGGYRNLIERLKVYNPNLRVIGLTATPYRLGHGLITEGSALFSDLIEPVSIEQLIEWKYLCTLRSKLTKEHFDLSKVAKRGGEYVEGDLQKAVNKADKNAAIAAEIIALSGERKSWIIFCTGVAHAEAMQEALILQGVTCACIIGTTPKAEREAVIRKYKAGEIRAITNANVLTTGFDAPDTDLIAMLRPTMSPTLYVQMAGRGMRPKEHTDHCLVLDFAGVVSTHGPITAVKPPKKKGEGNGEAPVKVCDKCFELVHISAKVCPACGFEFPPPPAKKMNLHHDDIMGQFGTEMRVVGWRWSQHTSRASGKDMLKVRYDGENLSDPVVTEYYPVLHEGYAGERARRAVHGMIYSALNTPVQYPAYDNLRTLSDDLSDLEPPSIIEYQKDGNFYRVVRREWSHAE